MDKSFVQTVVVLVVVFSPFCFHCKPMGGKFTDTKISLNESEATRLNMKVRAVWSPAGYPKA